MRFVNKPGPIVSMMINNIGMIKIPNNVAVVIPATTVIPMDVRAPEPAPVDTANGNTPRINAKDVIHTTLVNANLSILDNQNRIFRSQANQG